MRRMHKSLMAGVVVTFLGTSLFYTNLPLDTKLRKPDVEKDIQEAISLQEEIFGIKHIGKPDLSLSLPLIYELSGNRGLYRSFFQDRVFLASYLEISEVMEVTAHELGHRYTSQLAERIDEKYWGLTFNQKGVNLVSQGIAEYFEQRTLNKRGWYTKRDRNFPVNSINDDRYDAYIDGYFLLEPILEQNLELGIEDLITNLPTEEELLDLKSYQNRIFRIMDRQLRLTQ